MAEQKEAPSPPPNAPAFSAVHFGHPQSKEQAKARLGKGTRVSWAPQLTHTAMYVRIRYAPIGGRAGPLRAERER